MKNKKDEEKFVTLAIHSFEKAQILKTILENNGIEVYLHNINLIQPIVSSGVRVRIKETDLNAALKLIEDSNFNLAEEPNEEIIEKEERKVLVPIDFSDYSLKACYLAFSYANLFDAEVIILHAYYSPLFSNPLPVRDFGFNIGGEEMAVKKIVESVTKQITEFSAVISEKIKTGELPNVRFKTILKEGVPEEEIIHYSRHLKPALVVMGTRGIHRKELDIIGSVTAEVMDRTRFPLFAFPENTPFKIFNDVKNMAFITNFEERDLISFDYFIGFLKKLDFTIHFIHIAEMDHKDQWDNIKLAGLKDYFKKQYPDVKVICDLIKTNKQPEAINNYVKENAIDVIALTNKRRNIIARLFNPSIARKMLFHTDTPMFIFP